MLEDTENYNLLEYLNKDIIKRFEDKYSVTLEFHSVLYLEVKYFWSDIMNYLNINPKIFHLDQMKSSRYPPQEL